MDNGALVFIIIIEAIVIVWLASKLKQYEKFEHMLGAGSGSSPAAAKTANATAASASPNVSSPGDSALQPEAASAATLAVAGAVGSGDESEELLDMPGVDPEANIEEAKRVQLVMARCRYAEFYLEQLDDDYERGQFQRIVNSCKNTAINIQDPFFRASALHPLITLLDRAEWATERDQLLAQVDDEMVRLRITEELAAPATA